MNEIEIYSVIRNEILTNHVLMHVTTLLVVLILLGGIWLSEKRKSIVSVFLPLLSLAWAASIVRFDYFIHRQGAYLRVVEARLQQSGVSIPLWETWKSSLSSTAIVMPIADFMAILVVVVPTIYLLLSPAQDYLSEKNWRGRRVYAWGIIAIIGLLLSFLPFIPYVAQK